MVTTHVLPAGPGLPFPRLGEPTWLLAGGIPASKALALPTPGAWMVPKPHTLR